uniref:uncharacterized protein LOC122609005 n=1 Tax=Erigeron canadensis TaxID=72917 RepID=UPI001CB978E3|nr:uncharacterized protein LOC122609005 [Erigeron canadensis]
MTLFKIQCTACKVLDHIIPPTTESSTTSYSTTASSSHDAEWLRIDAIVLQWIYNTITPSLLTTILQPNNTAAQAWTALARIFVDNKPTQAVFLCQKFSNTKLSDFSSVSAYCQELKV